jgi:hypothetical protein
LGCPQGQPQYLAQPMDPDVDLALAETEQQSHHFLEGVGLEVEQNEEQLVFCLCQGRLAPPTVLALAFFPFNLYSALFKQG